MTTIMGVTFGKIKNVKQDCVEAGVYYADVELSAQEGFPMEWYPYTARSDDLALTGKWVYQQIIDGNFDGEITLTELTVEKPPRPFIDGAIPVTDTGGN